MNWEITVPLVVAIASPLFYLAYNKKKALTLSRNKGLQENMAIYLQDLLGLVFIMIVWNFALDFYYVKLSENYDREMGNPELYYETIAKIRNEPNTN